uniref:Putative transposase (Putative), gypsy type n=1 Tax=Tanacetum cinerariifolium TaxID=118510 RepID=A0A6L2NI48_TANCI|nr:putative transposase (putative), gypsy type [Tanacetum cinerariifolium]
MKYSKYKRGKGYILVLLLARAFSYRLGSISFLNSLPFFEMVGNTIDIVTFVLTQRELNYHFSSFNIPAELRPELLDRSTTIKDSPSRKIGVYTCFVEFANFRIDTSVCLLSIPWFNGTSVIKNPLHVDDVVDLTCVEVLDENCTLIRKYPKVFLCVVGLSRSYTETDVYPTFLFSDDEEIGLLEFVKFVDPFKPQPATAGKSPTAMRRLIKQNSQVDTASGSAAPSIEDIVSSFITPTQEHDYEDGFIHSDNVRTCPPSGQFIFSSSSVDTDILTSSQTITAHDVYVPTWNVTNDARIDHPVICQNLLDHVTPPGYWVALRIQSNVGFLDSFNVNSAQHVCMVSELRLPYKYEIMAREKFKKKFTDSFVVIQKRDGEIVDLRSRLEKAESEHAKVNELCRHVSELKVKAAVKASEIVGLNAHNVESLGKISTLESVPKIREEFASLQDAAAQCFEERSAELHARIAEVKHDMDNDLYLHMLTVIVRRRWVIGHGFCLVVMKCAHSFECHLALIKVISLAINKGIQQGLEAGIEHGKAGIFLAEVEAYDPKIQKSEMLLSYALATLRGRAGKRKVGVPSGAVGSGYSFIVPS